MRVENARLMDEALLLSKFGPNVNVIFVIDFLSFTSGSLVPIISVLMKGRKRKKGFACEGVDR